MTFKDWLLSSYPNPHIDSQWGILHIAVLIMSICAIISIALLFRSKDEKVRKIVIYILTCTVLFFELTRRILNIIKNPGMNLGDMLYTLLPRPWCAISCWALMIAVWSNKQFMYNTASFTALLCATIFFAYPGAGFNSQYMLFENIYSIATHALLLITSISFITLKFTHFEYKNMWKDLICLGVIFLYAFYEIWILDICSDPLYFMPNNDVQTIIGLDYIPFLIVYVLFMAIYVNAFYMINDRKIVKEKLSHIKSHI